MKPFRAPSNLLLLLLTLLFCAALAEVGSRFLFFSAEERATGSRQLWLSQMSDYVARINGYGNCTAADSIRPSPYFLFNYGPDTSCKDAKGNNIGVLSPRDYPLERDPAYFTIALLGGSVAHALCAGSGKEVWLEHSLNEQYLSPNGKPFRIACGAAGGWSYPRQLTFLSIYGRFVDAAISLDGFNEANITRHRAPPYLPDWFSFLASTYSLKMPASLALLLSGKYAYLLTTKFAFLKDSFFLYQVFRAASHALFAADGIAAQERLDAFQNFYGYPYSTPPSQRAADARLVYEQYIGQLAGISQALGLAYAHFLQPIAALGKPLTARESKIAMPIPIEHYRLYLEASERQRRRGLHSASLLNAYANERGDIYSDAVHFLYDADNNSRAGQILSEAIAKELATFWRLKKR